MKKIVLALFAFAAVCSAHASYMYWQAEVADDNAYYGDVAQARLVYYNAGGNVVVPSEGSTDWIPLFEFEDSGTRYKAMNEVQTGDLSSLTDKLFFIELANESGEVISRSNTSDGWMGAYTYSQLVSKGIISTDPMDSTVATFATGEFSAVPEPCSAGLLMLGLSLMALRRRRA